MRNSQQIVKKLLTLLFCWILSSLPGTTWVFCKKSCCIKLKRFGWPNFPSIYLIIWIKFSPLICLVLIWLWIAYFNLLLSSFFFFNSMNSYFVFYWTVKLLWFFFLVYAFKGLYLVPPPYSRIGRTWYKTCFTPRSAFCYLNMFRKKHVCHSIMVDFSMLLLWASIIWN